MKKITSLIFTLFAISFGYAQDSNYCSTQVFHLNIPAEVNSAINLTIVNTGANSTKITAAASDITFLSIVGTPIAGGAATASTPDTSVTGEISITLTWATAPANVVVQFLQWRKTSTGGATWQIENATTPFSAICGPPTPPEKLVTLSDLKLDGATIAGFGETKKIYDIERSGPTPIPQVTAVTPTTSGATVSAITQATAVPGSATFTVTSQDATASQIYTINFSIPSPQVAAPTPPARATADVVSVFSDAYTSISPINLDAAWCGANAIEATTAGGNAILAYKDKACQGINFATALQNVTGFTNVHVDLFIKAGTDLVGKVFNVKIVPTSGAESEFLNIDINGLDPKPVPGTWFSFDRAITFAGPTTDIKEIGVTSNFNNNLWYDNLYFHKNTTLSTTGFEIAEFNVFPNPSKDSWTVKTQNVSIASIQVYDVLGKNVLSMSPNASEATIFGSSLKTGLYFAQIKTANGISTLKLVKK